MTQLLSEIAADIADVVGQGPASGKDMAFGGAYEGAEKFDRMLATWQPSQGSADFDILGAKTLADARSRDLNRNDGYVQSGAQIAKDSIVGGMYLLNLKPEWKLVGGDEKWAEEIQEEVETKFTIAAESPNCWFDAARTKTFTDLVRLAVGCAGIGGEVLASAEWLRDRSRPFKTAVQMIDTARLSNPYEATDPNAIIRGGVRLNHFGAPEGYYIRMAHPYDFDKWDLSSQWKYIPARKPWGRMQIIHLKEELRPDQTRAVADIVAGLKEIKITKKFRDITLQKAVVQAMYAASIESDLPPDIAFQTIGAPGKTTSAGQAVTDYAAQYMSAVGSFLGKKGITIDGVKIPHFFPGTRLAWHNQGSPSGVGQDFEQSLLRYIAAILGISYEELSKDFSKTNYSSARAALTQTWKRMQSRKKLFADRFATIIMMLWFEEQMNAGQIEAMKYSKLANYYDPLMAEAYTSCEWIGAARGQIDELKETQAAVLRIKFGLSTHEDELGKLGKDWRKVYAQLERERIEREDRGIILQEDNSVNAASGSPREQDRQNSEGADADAEAA